MVDSRVKVVNRLEPLFQCTKHSIPYVHLLEIRIHLLGPILLRVVCTSFDRNDDIQCPGLHEQRVIRHIC